VEGEHLRSSENFVLNELGEFHKFGLEWTPDELIFYVDDTVTRHLNNSENERSVPDAYQMVFYSMSAGTWGGNVADPTNSLPARSEFDYCRVYQTKDQDAFYRFGSVEKLINAENRQGSY
jgi:beta-glucanase (GH16 family)